MDIEENKKLPFLDVLATKKADSSSIQKTNMDKYWVCA